MTIETDPKLVREIAETAFRSDTSGSPAERVEAALIASGVAGPVLGKRFDVWTKAVAAEYERLAGADEPGTTRMSDDRLAELDQRITSGCDTYDCDCDNAPCGLEPREARELLTEVKRRRTFWDLFPDIADITAWLDESNPSGPHEDSMRVLKLVEEAGEAAAAYIGMVGQNPRKGVTHTQHDLLNELADVAITALCTMQHFTQDEAVTRACMASKVGLIMARSNIRVRAGG